MLHAVNQRKAKLSAFKGAGQRVPLEDVVTSTIFGSLTFLRSQERSIILSSLFSGLRLAALPADQGLHIQFWPKMPLSASGFRARYVEPDLTITDPSGATVLIEVKWGAPLSPLELSSQWLSVDAERRPKAQHLLLVLEPSRYRSSIEHCRRAVELQGVSTWPLQTRSWRDFADQCRRLSFDQGLESGARNWARLVHAFLRRENPGSMIGWDDLELWEVLPLNSRRHPKLSIATPGAVKWRVQ